MYPQKGKKVFDESTNDSQNAIISFSFFTSKSYEYENSYLNSADILVEAFLCKKGDFNSNLVYPIVFLYRQYLELFMKDILKEYYKVNFPNIGENEERIFEKILREHNLKNLWEKVEEIASFQKSEFPTKIDDIDFVTVLNNAKEYISEIENVDRSSFAFRYPTDKKDELYHVQKDEKVDLINLKECIHEISSFFLMIQGILFLTREKEKIFLDDLYM